MPGADWLQWTVDVRGDQKVHEIVSRPSAAGARHLNPLLITLGGVHKLPKDRVLHLDPNLYPLLKYYLFRIQFMIITSFYGRLLQEQHLAQQEKVYAVRRRFMRPWTH